MLLKRTAPRAFSPAIISKIENPPTPLSQIVAKVENIQNTDKVAEALGLWNLHAISTNEATAQIKRNVKRKAGNVAVMNILSSERNRVEFIQDWRIAALRRGQGCSKIWNREILTLDEKTGFIEKAKPIQQDLRPATREKILTHELQIMKDHIGSLRDGARFITRISPMELGDIQARLIERAIQAFRWTYPFVDHPGKVMTTAMMNYVLNLKRDAFVYLNKEVILDSDSMEKHIDREAPEDIDPDVNILQTAIAQLDDKILESLWSILREKGAMEFAIAMSHHMDASPNRILKLMAKTA